MPEVSHSVTTIQFRKAVALESKRFSTRLLDNIQVTSFVAWQCNLSLIRLSYCRSPIETEISFCILVPKIDQNS